MCMSWGGEALELIRPTLSSASWCACSAMTRRTGGRGRYRLPAEDVMTDWVREEARRQLVACNCLTDSVDRQLAESCLRAGLREGTPAENGMRFCCYCGGALKP